MSAGSGGETIREALLELAASGVYFGDSKNLLREAAAALAAAEEATKEANAQEDEWMRQRDHFESAWQLQRERAISAEAERDRAQEALRAVQAGFEAFFDRERQDNSGLHELLNTESVVRAALAAGGREPGQATAGGDE